MMDPVQTMPDYYARRVFEYEKIYDKAERQPDLKRLAERLSGAFPGRDVLEVACGTGYWTRFIASSARSVIATDINTEVIEIARLKDYGSCRVSWLQTDAYTLACAPSGMTAGFHGFWWSHIPVQRIPEFLSTFHARLEEGALVVMIDNSYVDGSSTPITHRDEHGNTYQARKLEDGSSYRVLKNFPSPGDLQQQLRDHALDVCVTQLTYFWMVEYRKK